MRTTSTTPGPTKLGLSIRRYRLAHRLTTEELGDRAGVTGRIVRKIEDGSTRGPRLTTLVAIAEAVGISVSDLLRDAGM